MGNCCRRESSAVWASVEEQWEESITTSEKLAGMEKESFLGNNSNYRASLHEEKVKIKITKKRLDEFLGRVEMQELTVEQALCRLVDSGAGTGDHPNVQCHKPWRPRLHSIPEID